MLWKRLIAWVVGALSGLLVARLLGRLLAGREDNPALRALYRLRQPLVAPFARLDAGQPRFGAVLEFSTLAALVLLLVLGYGAWWLVRIDRRERPPTRRM